jgi:hypothetical protein
LIEKLFKDYRGSFIRKKKEVDKNGDNINPRNLVIMLYLCVVGGLLEMVVVDVRKGLIGICVYLEVLFLLLVGYYNKNAVRYLMVTNAISILCDGIGLFWL